MAHYDIVVIGSGVIGSSIAYGLSQYQNLKIAVIDERVGYKASLGNFGLIWLQSKGYNNPDYARSSEQAVRNWGKYAEELQELTGIDLQYAQEGGIAFFLGEEDARIKKEKIANINSFYQYKSSHTQILERDDMLKLYPHFGEKVIGGSFNPLDSHINPLYLLKAQIVMMQKNGVTLYDDFKIIHIDYTPPLYTLKSHEQSITAHKLVVSAGLGSSELMSMLGYFVPIRPQRGQIIVTEKMPDLHLPISLFCRQTKDATITFGYSNEEVGYDLDNDEEVIKNISINVIEIYPKLKDLQVLRCWSSLRILPKDGASIYDFLNDNTLFVVSTHSGITLAPMHANLLSKSIIEGELLDTLKPFRLNRFKKEIA